MSMIKKYLEKDISLLKIDRNILMIQDYYNSIIMEYQKMINLVDNTPTQPTKFRTKNWVEKNGDLRELCSTGSQN